ncbi:hypothetical protein GJ744_010185 [Endocarpon pusillum]|uniref:Major facilitator superfamily (MFS) profile domain-containing protein n=1 Tax=Endocarpon pusillum TaxID=364733 RepID=A0A8H7AIN7_9EURO|nr:hypothetical protein GJ744_010185 [Endocarpon pusillum]
MKLPGNPSRATRTLFLIGCIVLAEPLSSTLLFPFVYFMVKDFGKYDEVGIGYRAGLITSAFFLAQMSTTSIWGHVSDRKGRRTALLIGLLGGIISMVLFGLSKSLIWAILSRAFCGILNGNIGVARTVVGEVVEQHGLKQSEGFSLFGFCAAVGYIVGPMIGGWLVMPAKAFNLRGPGDLFVHFPYLLPCLVSAAYNSVVFVGTFCFLEETNEKLLVKETKIMEEDSIDTEYTSLLGPDLPASPSVARVVEETNTSKEVLVLVAATSLISLHGIIFDEGFSLFTASSLETGTGLGFRPKDIATSLSLMGPVIFIAQLWGYPFLNSRLDTLKLWYISSAGFATVYPLVSLMPMIQQEGMRWVCLQLLLAVRFMSLVVGYTSLNILVNHVIAPGRRGLVNGAVQSAASFSRAGGPALGGVLWSRAVGSHWSAPFDFHIFFILLAVIAIFQGFAGLWIPKNAASKN